MWHSYSWLTQIVDHAVLKFICVNNNGNWRVKDTVTNLINDGKLYILFTLIYSGPLPEVVDHSNFPGSFSYVPEDLFLYLH